MSLLTVYRVEDARTKGPYLPQAYRTHQQTKLSREMASRHSDGWLLPVGVSASTRPEAHPGPEEDPGMSARWRFMDWSSRRGSRAYNFGFESTDRLAKWFFGERDTLELLNMHVAAYTVPHQAVIRGEWQLAFRRPSATLQSTMDLKGLVE